MYEPPLFKEERREVLHQLISNHPFAMLVSQADGELNADHLPLILHTEPDGTDKLTGHITIANPLLNAAEENQNKNIDFNVLAAFQGAQTYITPSWYPSKQEHGKVVPTWNYVVVHARGTLRLIRDSDWLIDHLTRLTGLLEYQQNQPWSVSDAPDEFLARQMKGIVGIEITVESLNGKWKTSQNKTAMDRRGVVNGLRGETNPTNAEMARLVASTLPAET